ncbi:MAG: hypothetical protein JW819_01800, partial [Candidatus Krumholzibacteriota bacterium]|nr:hypothetical protein [Candidatus Krumholzibacteriota bacterium]
MSLSLGIDIGAVSARLALLGGDADRAALAAAARLPGWRLVDAGGAPLLLSAERRVRGAPVAAALDLLGALLGALPGATLDRVRVVGSGGRLLAERLALTRDNEYRALAAAAALLHPGARSVIEMGGETAKFLRLDAGGAILDFAASGDCAAGTGSFLDQQASRLEFAVEEIGARAGEAARAARIAGRCSVFAKSDMIHAQQKGYAPEEILRGLCDAVARNVKGNVTRGREVAAPALFVGGVACNEAVVRSLREVFGLDETELLAPAAGPWFGAVGAASLAAEAEPGEPLTAVRLGAEGAGDGAFETHPPLSLDGVRLLRAEVRLRDPATLAADEPVTLGIDVGSVSTNLVALDADGRLLHEIYTGTRGRPIAVVSDGLRELRRVLGGRGRVAGVGTTGSGRELIGVLLGADTVNDEITAHKTGAAHVAAEHGVDPPDTIFEIGGQDSKFISLDGGIVVDFAMNEACAAGTGSFLEEQAERLGVSIRDEFARLALSSPAPVRLGERCTVFMERDLNARLQRGAGVADLCAGLCHSIVLNYLNRVVGGRHVGSSIFFQGGTAYNDAVAAAFAGVLGKEIVVPPHNGVLGAVGAALLAREKAQATGAPSTFRGWEIEAIDYQLRKFTCKGCTNRCDIEEFTVDGTKTYWGDKCSERYRRRARTALRPVLEDLTAWQRRRLEACLPPGPARAGAPRVGVPRAMYYYDRFPFWAAWLGALGAEVVLSEPTNRALVQAGHEHTVAEPCHPVTVAHGHVVALLEREDVDLVLLPNVIDAEASPDQVESYLCPWGQTLPFVVRSAAAVEPEMDRLLIPRVRFRDGLPAVRRALRPAAARLGAGAREADAAVAAALAAQRAFEDAQRA